MDVELNIDTNEMKIDYIITENDIYLQCFRKRLDGQKRKNKYVFSKNHGKKEVLLDDYLNGLCWII